MKKLLAVTFATTMVLGLAGVASAVHIEAPADTSSVVAMGGMVTLHGDVRSRFKAAQGLTKDSAVVRGNDLRVRFGANIQTSDAVSGHILLENGSGSTDYEGWGLGSSTGLNDGGWKKGTLTILEAWAQYVPGKGGIKVGHMPLALGNSLFFDHTGSGDDAVVAFYNPNENTHIAGLFIKFLDEGSGVADESDVQGYVGLGTLGLGNGMKLGANWTHLDQKGSEMRFNNIGLNLDGKVGEIGFKLDFEKNLGDLATDYKAEGWAAQGEVSMGLGNMTVGALIGYGTGEDRNAAADKTEAFVNFLTDTRYQSTMIGYVLAVPDISSTGVAGNAFNNDGKNTGLTNLQLYQLNASANTKCPISGKDLALKGRINYAKLNETSSAAIDDSVGTELELFATWKLDNGLSFGFEGAYLIAGDAYKEGVASADPENPWFTRATLNLAF